MNGLLPAPLITVDDALKWAIQYTEALAIEFCEQGLHDLATEYWDKLAAFIAFREARNKT